MGRRRLTATLFAIPGILILLGLGTWQVQRLFWKEALIAERAERSAAAPIALPAPESDLTDIDFLHAAAAGTFQNDQEMLLAARSLNGRPGFHVVTPLLLNGDQPLAGRLLLVDRGWIPLEVRDPAARAAGQLDGPQRVDGLLRPQREQHWLEPDNRPAENAWYWVDVAAMATHVGLADAVLPYYLEAGPAANPGGLPIGWQSHVNLPNDHLQYAIIWYALAAALAVIYTLFMRRKGETES